MQTHEWERLLYETPADHLPGKRAVAEVIRLRKAMTRLRNAYSDPDDPGDDYGRGMEAAYQIAARDLTLILEGRI